MVARVAVIGAGGMGSWFARFFRSRGDSVTVSDQDPRRAKHLALRVRARYAPSNLEAARGSDIVILAIPASVVLAVVKEILPVLRTNALLCDICAIKSVAIPALRIAQKRGLRVASIHPMFGPLASGLRGRRIVAVRTGKDTRGYQMMKHILEDAKVFLADRRIHDKQMATTLALPHFLNMVFATAVSRGRNLAEIRKFAGRTFNLQMLLAEAIAGEPETIADIEIMNKEFRIILRDLQRDIRALAEIVKKQDRAGLVARYKQVKELLSADPEFKASGRAFEKVSEAYSSVSKTQLHDTRPLRGH
jgi:prephenate dehydrogenase